MTIIDTEPWFDAVWRRVRAQLHASMDEGTYDYWIRPLTIVSATPEAIVIACGGHFKRERTVDKFGQRIADLISANVPELGKVDFVYDPAVKPAIPPPQVRRATRPVEQRPVAAARANERRVLIEDIKRAVAERYKITVGDLESASRKRSFVRPRQIAMLVARRVTDRSFPEIGRRLGDRDHTTIIHGCRKIERQCAIDAILAAEVDALMRQFIEQQMSSTAGGGAHD